MGGYRLAMTIARGSLLAIAALAAACSQAPQASVQVGTPRQVSSPAEPLLGAPRASQWPAEVEARVGQPVIFRLPGTAGTGYMWQLVTPVCDALPLAFSQQLESSTDGRVGGPSMWVFTFTAEAAGACAMTFHYHRPWERGVAPAETRSVTVNITP
jgi:predicted secreted protein